MAQSLTSVPKAKIPPLLEAPKPMPALTAKTMERLAGRRKAAVLIAALGPELAANVIPHLETEEIEQLSLEMTKLGAVSNQVAEAILEECSTELNEGKSISCGLQMTREILESAFGGEKAEKLLHNLAHPNVKKPFEFLQNIVPERIAFFLRDESLQTIALIIGNLQPEIAAQVLGKMPEDTRPEISLRIAKIGETTGEVIQQIENVMRQKLDTVVQHESAPAGGAEVLANILSSSDHSTENDVLDHLENADSELAEEVRKRLFIFEDIFKLDPISLQKILREVDQKDLILALRGAPKSIEQKVLTNMSERAAEILSEELELQKPQRKRDIEAAQGKIIEVVRRMESEEKIIIARGDTEEDAFV